MNTLVSRTRNSRGTTTLLVAVASAFILLPLGILSFDVARLYLAQTQLQNAVDAAALSALVGLANPSIAAPGMTQHEAAEKYSLMQFSQNSIVGSRLTDTKISRTVPADTPPAGTATYQLSQVGDKVRSEAAFGLATSFGNFLGFGTVPIRAVAFGGTKSLQGDIVICLDISDSTKGGSGINNQPDGSSSKTWNVSRHTNAKGVKPKFTYLSVTKAPKVKGGMPIVKTITPRLTNAPAGLHVGGNYLHSIAVPSQVFKKDAPLPALYQPFAGESPEVQTALLAESKQGHLNSQAAYNKAKVGDTILGDEKYFGTKDKPGRFKPDSDYRAAYQEVALPFVHPLADEKRDIKKLVKYIVEKNPDANIALVGFCPKAGGRLINVGKGLPKELGPEQGVVDGSGAYGYGASAGKGFQIPFVRFAKANSKIITDTVDVCSTASGTNIPDSLKVAHALLTEDNRNLKGTPQICFLFTDGVPTVGGSVFQAKRFGKDGIPIVVFGYSNIGYSAGVGPRVCRRIAKAGGGGSKYIPVPYTKQPGRSRFNGFYQDDAQSDAAIASAFIGTPVLVNK